MRELVKQLVSRFTNYSLHVLDNHPGKVFGVLAGFILGMIVVLLGFWRTLVVALFIAVGFFIGKRHDEHRDFGELLEILFGERK